jgi:hypothetical protein
MTTTLAGGEPCRWSGDMRLHRDHPVRSRPLASNPPPWCCGTAASNRYTAVKELPPSLPVLGRMGWDRGSYADLRPEPLSIMWVEGFDGHHAGRVKPVLLDRGTQQRRAQFLAVHQLFEHPQHDRCRIDVAVPAKRLASV